jgi:hypothetical protein
MSLAKIIYHVPPLIVRILVCVMLVLGHINCHINCPPVLLLTLCNLFSLMSGVMLLSPLVEKGTMFPLLMTIVSLLGYTYSVINLKSISIFLSFRPLLSACLIVRSSPSNPTGVENMSISIPYSTKLASLIKCLVLTPINKMGLQSASTTI